MHPYDPSWCARLDAHRAPAAHPALDESAASPAPDEAAAPSTEAPATYHCDLCGAVMYEHNCKIVCPNCGYKRDCTDP